MPEFSIRGKRVSVCLDGHIFVNGNDAKLKQWKSSSTQYPNLQGTEQKDLSGCTLEQALYLRGLL